MFQHLNDSHLRYIIIRYHCEGAKPKLIFKELTDPEAKIKYMIDPVPQLTIKYLYARIPRISSPLVEMTKIEYFNDLLSVPLANKKVRVLELANLYYISKNKTEKRHLLKAIQEEVGEEAWQEAIKKSGDTVQVTLAEEMQEFFRDKR